VVPALYPGVGTTRGPSTTPPWDHTLVPRKGPGPDARGWPRAQRRGGGEEPPHRAHGRSGIVRVTRPSVVAAPLTGSWEGTVAGTAHTTRTPS